MSPKIKQVSKQTSTKPVSQLISVPIQQLTNVVDTELDAITLSLMEQPNDSIDPETFNLVAEEGIHGYLEYCLWGNVVKNPRLVYIKD